jgi:hypothetical protein
MEIGTDRRSTRSEAEAAARQGKEEEEEEA